MNLKQFNDFAVEYRKLKKNLDDAEAAHKQAKARLDDLVQKRIPDAMDSEGVSDFTTDDGLKMTLKRTIRASITAKNRDKAFKWLKDNGLGHLIKPTFSVVPPDEKNAEQLEVLFSSLPFKHQRQEKVNPNSLSAVVRELLRDGQPIDHDLLGVFDQREAIIKETDLGI